MKTNKRTVLIVIATIVALVAAMYIFGIIGFDSYSSNGKTGFRFRLGSRAQQSESARKVEIYSIHLGDSISTRHDTIVRK